MERCTYKEIFNPFLQVSGVATCVYIKRSGLISCQKNEFSVVGVSRKVFENNKTIRYFNF